MQVLTRCIAIAIVLSLLFSCKKDPKLSPREQQELEEQTGREVVVASVYATLERLQERGLVASSLGDSTPERGGRAKRYFRITGAGMREVRDTRRSLMNLWKGLPELKGEKA